MRFCYKKSYLKQFDGFLDADKQLIICADKLIREYYVTYTGPYGLRIKKLYQDGGDKIFEARVSDKIRIIWVESQGVVVFSVIGSHDEIRKYINHLD